MMLKRLFALITLLTVLVSSLGFAASAGAQTTDPPGASGPVALCRMLDEQGQLDQAAVTFGECVTIFANELFSAPFIAGICGIDTNQESLGTTNKGQCIKVLNELLGEDGP